MKRIFILIFLICNMIALPSCERGNRKKEKIFSHYLDQEFRSTLSDESGIYIAITSNGCLGCRMQLLHLLSSQTSRLKLITKEEWGIPLPDNIQILRDRSGGINRLNMGGGGTYALFVEKGKIVELFVINPSNLSLLQEKIDQFCHDKTCH